MAKKPARQVFKMAELVRRTGLKKETIHFYINNDLLPRPPKTERNVAYYDESYVERIRLIRELQQKYFLPLRVVKQIVSQASARISTAEIDLLKLGMSGLLQLQELRRTHEPMTLDELSASTGLPEDEILEMESYEIISSVRDSDGRRVYEENDIKVVEAFAGIRKGGLTAELGFDVEGFKLQSDVIGALALEEVTGFVSQLRARFPRDAELLGKISENAIETVNVYICQLRRKKILEIVQALGAGGMAALRQMLRDNTARKRSTITAAPRRPQGNRT